MIESPNLTQLIDDLRCLPGVGEKTARRMAYYLLQRDRPGGRRLAGSMCKAIDTVGHCRRCRTFSELDLCPLCLDQKRDKGLLCVVEGPADVALIEQSGYRGLYFVLMGHLSPLDGIGPEDLGIDQLALLLDEGNVEEVILATGSTVEGEATVHFIGNMVRRRRLKASRIARGMPMGGDLEYLNKKTIMLAMEGRREV